MVSDILKFFTYERSGVPGWVDKKFFVKDVYGENSLESICDFLEQNDLVLADFRPAVSGDLMMPTVGGKTKEWFVREYPHGVTKAVEPRLIVVKKNQSAESEMDWTKAASGSITFCHVYNHAIKLGIDPVKKALKKGYKPIAFRNPKYNELYVGHGGQIFTNIHGFDEVNNPRLIVVKTTKEQVPTSFTYEVCTREESNAAYNKYHDIKSQSSKGAYILEHGSVNTTFLYQKHFDKVVVFVRPTFTEADVKLVRDSMTSIPADPSIQQRLTL